MIPNDAILRFYRGNSMHGTFHLGDRLVIVAIPFADIKLGDVLVFHGKNYWGETVELVHRVNEITDVGLVTRGDNNLFCDANLVQPEQIVGKVIMVETRGRKKVVIGGVWGLWKVIPRRVWLKVDYWFRWLFRMPYHLLRLSKIAPKLWRTKIKMIYLRTNNGLLVKYTHKGRTVATWDSIHKRFNCLKPFDLVIPHPEEPK